MITFLEGFQDFLIVEALLQSLHKKQDTLRTQNKLCITAL